MSTITLPQRAWIGKYNAQTVLKGRAISKERKVTQFEIELPIEDGGTSYINGESHPIRTNTVICAKPGDKRQTRSPFKCYYVHMVVTDGLIYEVLTALPNFIEMQNTGNIKDIFERLCNCHVSEKEERKLLQQGLLLELVYALYRPTQSNYTKNSNAAVKNAVAYIKNNITADLSLETVAKEVKFAPSYFHKLFKSATGKPLHKYIEGLRIEKAANMLITEEMTLTQIAYECGFSSQSYFSYAFKRHTGMTPRAYAKRIVERYDR